MFSNAQKERIKKKKKRDDKERCNICGDESKKELLVLVPFQEREREREREREEGSRGVGIARP